MATGPHAVVPTKTGPAARAAAPKHTPAPASGRPKTGEGSGPNWKTRDAAKGLAKPKKGPA